MMYRISSSAEWAEEANRLGKTPNPGNRGFFLGVQLDTRLSTYIGKARLVARRGWKIKWTGTRWVPVEDR